MNMNGLRTTLLLTSLTALFILVGEAIGGHGGATVAFIFAVMMNMSAYWFSDRLVLMMHQAQEVNAAEAPELYRIVKQLAERANMPPPKIYIIDNPTPNAFATGRSPEFAVVAVTTGILNILTYDELTGVLAHELSHVRHHDILISSIAATIAGAIGMLANMAQWSMLFGMGRNNDNNNEEGHGMMGFILTLILAPITATLIQLAVSRSREYAADEGGAKLCGNPLWLASALRKLEIANRQMPLTTAQDNPATAHLFIVNPLSADRIGQLFATHPPIEERIRRLTAMMG